MEIIIQRIKNVLADPHLQSVEELDKIWELVGDNYTMIGEYKWFRYFTDTLTLYLYHSTAYYGNFYKIDAWFSNGWECRLHIKNNQIRSQISPTLSTEIGDKDLENECF